MHTLITKWMQRVGIKRYEEATPEEKQTIENWQKVLTGEKITVEKIVDFCQNQLKTIEGDWKNLDNKAQKNERLVLLHTVYRAILELIQAPEKERESLEKYLQSLLTRQ